MDTLFSKYQNIYNSESGTNIHFTGTMYCDIDENRYYLAIHFIGKVDGIIEYDLCKNFSISVEDKKSLDINKTLFMSPIYFKNIIDDLDQIVSFTNSFVAN
jgi:hypothetical protein